ncbi:unnamed protein product [Soboliphyme baturini]|uniref:C2 domain-containing protein n=1 Tax=Soboliphyme baturini TaxID=241478 RepID=A0A183ITV2_9BILA|nr:unnamed protein product [Soboliphyme baturini]
MLSINGFSAIESEVAALLDECLSLVRRIASEDQRSKPAKDIAENDWKEEASKSGRGQHKFVQLSDLEKEKLYIATLYAIKHKVEVVNIDPISSADLFDFVQDAFEVTVEDHWKYMADVREEKPPAVIINVVVVEAKDLKAKDVNGTSDPYCVLSVASGTVSASSRRVSTADDDSPELPCSKELEKRLSGQFVEKVTLDSRDMKCVSEVKATSVKRCTLNPVWNEKFQMVVDDVNTNTLRIDIWDLDDSEANVIDALKKLNEVNSLKGLSRYFKQVAQSAMTNASRSVDDYLGCVRIPIKVDCVSD